MRVLAIRFLSRTAPGMDRFSRFLERSRLKILVKFANDLGTVPVNGLLERSSVSRDLNLLRMFGIWPVRLLCPSFSVNSFGARVSIYEGILPVNEFSERSRNWTFLRV